MFTLLELCVSSLRRGHANLGVELAEELPVFGEISPLQAKVPIEPNPEVRRMFVRKISPTSIVHYKNMALAKNNSGLLEAMLLFVGPR